MIGIQELKFAVSFVIYRNGKEFLAVKRPDEDKVIGGMWGLPATGFDPRAEGPDEAVIRCAKDKLGCVIELKERLPVAIIQQRGGMNFC